ncbi:MAG TPA: hypothetical protein VIV60_11515, partial [Polyangiaceae bacterium]
GVNADNGVSALVEVYDPTTDEWRTASSIPVPRQYLVATAANGGIYTMGGNVNPNAVHEYAPSTDSWRDRTPMPTANSTPNLASIGDKSYVLGDRHSFIYDAPTDTWCGAATMPVPTVLAATGQIHGKIYIANGANNLEYTP